MAEYFDLVGGYKLPAIGLGTFTVTDEVQLETALEAALEAGYRHIDTAALYRNEHIIGRVLKKWLDAGKVKREDLFITTKLPGCQPPERVEYFIKTSLDKLQLDYLDLYLIHFPVLINLQEGVSFDKSEAQPSDFIATWKKMEEQVRLGRTRTIGISNFNKEQVKKVLENGEIKPATNQVELHVYLQQPELVKYCRDNGIVVVSYQSLGNPGLQAWSEANNYRTRRNFQNLFEDPVVQKIAAKHGKSIAQILLKFLVQKKIAVIPKSVTPNRIKENFNLFNFSLDSADINELESLDKGDLGRAAWFDFNESCLQHPDHPFGPKPKNLLS